VGAFIVVLVVLFLLCVKVSGHTLADLVLFLQVQRDAAQERAALRELEEEEDWEDEEEYEEPLPSPPVQKQKPAQKSASKQTAQKKESGAQIPDALRGILRRDKAQQEEPAEAEAAPAEEAKQPAAPTPAPAAHKPKRLIPNAAEEPEVEAQEEKAAPAKPEPLPQAAAFAWSDDDEEDDFLFTPAPTPVEEETVDIDFSDVSSIAHSVKATEAELLQASQDSEDLLDLPKGGVSVTREPAVKKVTGQEAAAAQQVVARQIAETAPVQEYLYPSIDLLEAPKAASNAGIKEEMASTEAILTDTIASFGINVTLKDVTRGPTVARFEIELDRGVKLSKLTNLAADIALSLGVSGVRIAPVPDKPSMVGIEVPNRRVNPVPIRSVIDTDAFRKAKSKVSFALGKDISGSPVVSDIAKMPHLLIAGTTGSGKSVCINSLLVSLLYKASPQDVRLIMVDPKKVELGIYNDIPHLLIPVVTEAKKAAGALQWAVIEMSRRYSEIADAGVRKLSEYNKLAEKDPDREPMPSIVIVIDELADLMMVAGKEVEESICRIAQLGRAAGMHLVVATQRPSADVITGLMKSNIPSRIAFAVASAVESRIILDSSGAETLVGKGDMLYHPIGSNKSLRVQGCLISDEEVSAVVDFVKQNSTAQYDSEVSKSVAQAAANTGGGKSAGKSDSEPAGDYDELVPDAVDVLLEIGQASVSMLQRKLKLGYARAARLMDQMEELGYVGPFEGSKPRQLKITKEEWAVKRAQLYGEAPDQTEFELNEGAMADDLLEMELPQEDSEDEEPEDMELLDVPFDLEE
jgi:S-DNA-T family DNA segregation ATPase FtsK/SpoIIIE